MSEEPSEENITPCCRRREVNLVNIRKVFAARFWPVLSIALMLTTASSYAVWKNHKTRRQDRAQTEHLNKSLSVQGPPIGTTISTLRGRTLSHQNVTFDFSHRKRETLLLVLSPVCPYCRVNFHNWRDILQTVPADQVVWVDLTGTADARYIATVGIPANANFISLEQGGANSNCLASTPTTVLLDSYGVVRWSLSGIMNDEQVGELRNLLKSPRS